MRDQRGAFGVLHFESGGSDASPVLYVLHATSFAFLAAAMVFAFRSLWPAIGVHLGTYIATDASAASGWGEGPTLWTAVAGVNIAVGAAIIAIHRRRQPDMPDPLYP
ncbi:MAG: hypothetical protein L0G22_07565 [Propionibacteriaceae bacterium]|nr:hypothetical protein [Propionibacteriaceae bacterium]